MPLEEMPQTFRDAVRITRRLGLKYLWIDSLCICQDDPEDWAREAGRMADVYSNAYVVIAANRSADSTGGCFHKRAPRANALLHIPIKGRKEYIHVTTLFPSDHSGSTNDSFSTEPLSKRGWALQERTMAQRTLHYNDRQMYFECLHGLEAEDGHIHKTTKNSHYQQFGTPESSISKWHSLVVEFSARKLSRGTDKLPALSGWAKKFQKAIGADYVAGLWSNALIQGMAWRCETGRRPADLEKYTGPSWSWASYDGHMSYSGSPNEIFAEAFEWHVEPKEEANLFGEVREAWIKIRGPVFGVKPILQGDLDHDYPLGDESRLLVSITGLTDYSEWYELRLDNQSYQDSGQWRNWDLQAIVLYGESAGGSRLNSRFKAIVVREAIRAGQRGEMERVGCINIYPQDDERVRLADRRDAWKTITLV